MANRHESPSLLDGRHDCRRSVSSGERLRGRLPHTKVQSIQIVKDRFFLLRAAIAPGGSRVDCQRKVNWFSRIAVEVVAMCWRCGSQNWRSSAPSVPPCRASGPTAAFCSEGADSCRTAVALNEYLMVSERFCSCQPFCNQTAGTRVPTGVPAVRELLRCCRGQRKRKGQIFASMPGL